MPCAHRSDDQQHRRPDADRRVGRQQADEERRDAHDDERIDQHRLAADPIAEVAEDDAAQRSREKPDRKGAERRQRADQRIDGRKEEAIEHQRRRGAVEKEVVPFDRRADEAGEHDAADRFGRLKTFRKTRNRAGGSSGASGR